MHLPKLPKECYRAEGSEGLSQALDAILATVQAKPVLAEKEYYIFYHWGEQQALLKLDVSQKPFRVWHYDLMGRPMTRGMKDTIAQFLWEKGGEKELFEMQDC